MQLFIGGGACSSFGMAKMCMCDAFTTTEKVSVRHSSDLYYC